MRARTAARSAFEWVTAASIVLAAAWFSSDLARVWIGPKVPLSSSAEPAVAPDVPEGAISVSLLVLLDGREIRTGLTHAQLESLLPNRQAVQKPHVSATPAGTRLRQAYSDGGRMFFVTCERADDTGVMRVARIYVP